MPRTIPHLVATATLSLILLGAGCPIAVPTLDPGSSPATYDPERAWPGYTLYSGRYTEAAHLLDMDGYSVHSWSYPQGLDWCYSELLPGGTLGVMVAHIEELLPGMFLEFDWEGELLRQIDLPVHHDFVRLEDGDTILLCQEYVNDDDVHPGGLKSDAFVRVTPDGEITWTWHAHEHALKLANLVDLEFPRESRDWAHTNTIESLPASPVGDLDPRFREGNLLFSMCNLDTIGVIDGQTDEVVWAWGPGTLQGPHMPTMLENGHLLIYDNGDERGWSRILELDPLAEEVVWSYVADPPESFYSLYHGSNQRLPNGNTFVSSSGQGRLFEVTSEGDIVWEWITPQQEESGSLMPIYRTARYAPEEIEPRL